MNNELEKNDQNHRPILITHKKVELILQCITNLRIGGTETGFEIAGIDNPIVRNPLDGKPYIPGSSLKGKLRSLLELKYQKTNYKKNPDTAGPCECGKENCFVCNLFGCGSTKNTKAASRLIFRDSFLNNESAKLIAPILKDYTLIKTEVRIDRKKSTSADPREMCSVPAGAKFDIRFVIRVFKGDKEYWPDWSEKLAEAFELLENDYLGGCGTRGYGQVKIFGPDGKQSIAQHLKSLSI